MGHIFLPYIAPAGGVVFTDDFNRADENIEDSANWEELAGTGNISVGVVSNEFSSVSVTTGVREADGYTGTISTDHYAQVEVVSIPGTGTNEIAVFARGTFTAPTERNFYSFGYTTASGGSYRIVRWNEGGAASISVLGDDGGANSAPTAGDVLRLEASGTSLVGKLNGTTVASATDSNLTTGKPGIYTFFDAASRTTLLDNFECGEL